MEDVARDQKSHDRGKAAIDRLRVGAETGACFPTGIAAEQEAWGRVEAGGDSGGASCGLVAV